MSNLPAHSLNCFAAHVLVVNKLRIARMLAVEWLVGRSTADDHDVHKPAAAVLVERRLVVEQLVVESGASMGHSKVPAEIK